MALIVRSGLRGGWHASTSAEVVDFAGNVLRCGSAADQDDGYYDTDDYGTDASPPQQNFFGCVFTRSTGRFRAAPAHASLLAATQRRR